MQLKKYVLQDYLKLENSVDVTDPCYDRSVWCRMTVNNMQSGDYICSYYMGVFDDEDLKNCKESYGKYNWKTSLEEYTASWKDDINNRCFCIAIMLKGKEYDVASEKWTRIGEIGVDAGLAGFFPDKPDFDRDEWMKFCDKLNYVDNAYFEEGLGFWSNSGYGDGSYPVYAIEEGGKTVALKIRF